MTQPLPDTSHVINVAIVEDRAEVRDGLALLVNASDGHHTVGAFASAEDAMEALETGLSPDVVLMDIGLPGMDGVRAVATIKTRWPAIQFMMLTVYDDNERIFSSLEAGATGYVLKNTPPEQLLHDITTLFKGGSPMSSGIARRVVQTFHAPRAASADSDEVPLTPREEEILGLLSEGFRYREIAERLFISMDTVRTHIRHIYEKMHVRSRTEAAVKYLRRRGN